jgi:hypothetical protein
VRIERSSIEDGFGNFDWGVYLTLRVQTVAKGDGVTAGDRVVARCFVIKSRKSQLEYVSLQSHYPIPAVGQTVRAHLDRDWELPSNPRSFVQYFVEPPNGFTAVDGAGLVTSEAVDKLYSRRMPFTYLLPLELWILGPLLLAMVAGCVCLVLNIRRWFIGRRAAREAGERASPRFSLAGLLVVVCFTAAGFAEQPRWFLLLWILSVCAAQIWFTLRPPRTGRARIVWWGVNVGFLSFLVSLFVR